MSDFPGGVGLASGLGALARLGAMGLTGPDGSFSSGCFE
jgi:hypothetical protein